YRTAVPIRRRRARRRSSTSTVLAHSHRDEHTGAPPPIVTRRRPHDRAGTVRAPRAVVVSPAGLEGQQRRFDVVAVWDRVVAAIRGGVHGDDVGAVGEVGAAGDGEVPVVFVEDGQPAAFGGDVEPAGARVVGEDGGV